MSVDVERGCVYWLQRRSLPEPTRPKKRRRKRVRTVLRASTPTVTPEAPDLVHSDGPVSQLIYYGLPCRIIDRQAEKAVTGLHTELLADGYHEIDPWQKPRPHEFSVLYGHASVRFRWNPNGK